MPDISSIDNLLKTTIKKLCKIAPDDRLHAATLDFDNLQERKRRPDVFSDNGNRYYLKKKYPCCDGIREPSRGFPFTELIHGRTAVHVAHSHGLPNRAADIQSYRRLMNAHPELRTSAATAVSILAAHEARKTLNEIEASSRRTASSKKRKVVSE